MTSLETYDDATDEQAAAHAWRLTLRAAPRREPPYDDERDIVDFVPVGRWDRPLPLAVDRPAVQRPIPVVQSELRASLPDPAQWTRRLLIGVIESAAGRRPLQQLAPLVSMTVARGLGMDFERAAVAGRRHWLGASTIHSVHCSEPVDGVAELNATLRAGKRAHAVAVRLEVRHQRWCCTRLALA